MELPIEQHLVCPECGGDQYERIDGMHIFNKYRCLGCNRTFRQPISEESYRFKRLGELEGSMNMLIDKHPKVSTLKDLWSLIPKYVQVKNQQEDDFCKEYLRDHYRIRRIPELQAAMDHLMKEHMVISKIEDLYELTSMYILCWDKQENDYCRDYINKQYFSKAYRKYDDECMK